MSRLTFAEAQNNVADIANRESYTIDFLYELLAAYGRSRSAITKLREGTLNLADNKESEVLQRNVVYFKHVTDQNKLHSTAEELLQDPLTVRYNPRFIIVSDYEKLVAIDTKKNNRLDINLRDIDRDIDFFYGWTGDEVTDQKTEALADRRAADKMKDLYAEIEIVNRDRLSDPKSNFRHDLNVFFSRLLFCFFAEDTRVFSRDEPAMFTNAIKDYTQTDGSDLDQFLETLFNALDTKDTSQLTSPFSKFPYVNGTIFDTKKHSIGIPKFSAQARKLILDCGNQNWAEINPDIFGSMFQSIVDEEQRDSHGQHYTSVPNIMKTIEPLFLDELREEFDKYYDNENRLNKLWNRISKIKIFDPACGSGNFLIIAYKELRKIEHGIIERLYGDEHKRRQLAGKLESRIKLDNFYGIEIDDFPHEIAILSLYLAKHQMNIEFEQQFGREIKLIPLDDNANIVHEDATKIDWNEVCPNVPRKESDDHSQKQSTLIDLGNEQSELDLVKESWEEIYLIGNPPYLGSSLQNKVQKASMDRVFKGFDNYKNLDLIAAWFKLGTDYIKNTKAMLAFVSTNSICQGEQVALLWPYVFDQNVEIGFAYTSFKWTNSASNNAGVSCVVLGLRTTKNQPKYIFAGITRKEAKNINAYLVDGPSIFLFRRSSPLSDLPKMVRGSMPSDGGNLILEPDEYQELITKNPDANMYIKSYIGSSEFLNGKQRYCIWIEDSEMEEATKIQALKDRLNKVSEFRLSSDTVTTQEYAKFPNRFKQRAYIQSKSIIVPKVSSNNRPYIPIGYLDENTVISDLAFGIYNAEPYVIALLSSKMHMLWTEVASGRLGIGYRYSNAIVYNNFPVPVLTQDQINKLNEKARSILFTREGHSEKTLAEMYDRKKMPSDLQEAHEELDLLVDRLYRQKPYGSDKERLSDLFVLYEQMIEREKSSE